MDEILEYHDITMIISGGARGADKMAAEYAVKNGIPYKEFPADWNRHGKSAGYIRNKEIVKNADEVIAFWNGNSKGTAHTIRLAEEAGKPVYKYWSEPDEFAELGL